MLQRTTQLPCQLRRLASAAQPPHTYRRNTHRLAAGKGVLQEAELVLNRVLQAAVAKEGWAAAGLQAAPAVCVPAEEPTLERQEQCRAGGQQADLVRRRAKSQARLWGASSKRMPCPASARVNGLSTATSPRGVRQASAVLRHTGGRSVKWLVPRSTRRAGGSCAAAAARGGDAPLAPVPPRGPSWEASRR